MGGADPAYRAPVGRGEVAPEPAPSALSTGVVVAIGTVEIRASVFLALAHEPLIDLLASGTTAAELTTLCRALKPEVVLVEEGLSHWSNEALVDATGIPPGHVLMLPAPDSKPLTTTRAVDESSDLVSQILRTSRA